MNPASHLLLCLETMAVGGTLSVTVYLMLLACKFFLQINRPFSFCDDNLQTLRFPYCSLFDSFSAHRTCYAKSVEQCGKA